MSLQKKYFYTFRDLNNSQFTVEIWQETAAVISVTELRADLAPFTVNYPQIDSKLQPVRGSGCTLNLISATNMQLIGLYTADFQEYQIRLLTGGALIWCGFMDSELYSEPLGEVSNYSVSISGTDGFALLDRMNYLQANGSNFTGFISQFDILKFIIGKINLPFNSVFISLQTTITGVTNGTGQTVLNNTYVNNSNFYDEDGQPFTLRQVLESILIPYGAFIIQENGSLYITDIPSYFYDDYFYFIQYSASLVYLGMYNPDTHITDLSGQRFAPEQTLSIVSGINKQVVTYSPYKVIDVIDAPCNDFTGYNGYLSYGTKPLNWNEYHYTTSAKWSVLNAYNAFCKSVSGTEADSYLRIDTNLWNRSDVFTYTGIIPELISLQSDFVVHSLIGDGTWRSAQWSYEISDVIIYLGIYYVCIKDHTSDDRDTPNVDAANNWNPTTAAILNPLPTESMYFLKMEAEAYVRTTDELNGAGSVLDVYGCNFKVFCSFDNPATPVVSNLTWNFADVSGDKKNVISDKWVNLTPVKIPLWKASSRTLKFKIGGFLAQDINGANINSGIKDARLKNIKLSIVDYAGNEVQEADIEYTGILNPLYSNAGEAIELLQGTNVNDFPSEKGGLMTYSGGVYTCVKQWSRNGVTDNIENLLIRTVVGNYAGKSKQLTLITSFVAPVVGYLSYINVFGGARFMIIGSNKNFAECTNEMIIQEIFNDSLTINKLW